MSWTLTKKYRSLLAREDGYEQKVWGKPLSVCLVYPSLYRTGMANLGFQTVYELINNHPECLCERAFLPDPEDEPEFSQGTIPLFSLESQRPLREFDIIAFSIPFENDYPNILKILEMARIPFLQKEREGDDPLVIGGGIAVTLNPEPLADFFDLFFIGEAEEMLVEFIGKWLTHRQSGSEKSELLFSVQRDIEGLYVPCYYSPSYGGNHMITDFSPLSPTLPRKIKKRWLSEINTFETKQKIITSGSEFGEMFLTEVSRGCGHGCRFCAAGFIYRPVRFRCMDSLMVSLKSGMKYGRKMGLLGTAVSDHPDLKALCRMILQEGGRLAIGSLRLDRITDEMIGLLKEGGVETIALAPEAGSQRLRDCLHKGIREEQIFAAVESLIRHDMLNVRLYFMVGLPTETNEDIDAIVKLVKRIKHVSVKISSGTKCFRRITVSLNQFIPKAATPFQWHPLEDIQSVKKKIRIISLALRKDSSAVVIHDIPKWNYVQALLSLGDRRVASILMSVHRYQGNWSKALKETNVNPDFYVYRQKHVEEILPWDFIDHGVDGKILRREYQRAMQASSTEEDIV